MRFVTGGLRRPVRKDLTDFLRVLAGRRWMRFGMVGGAATLAYAFLGIFFVNLCGLPALAGNALAYALSFAVSYLGQSLWTFAGETKPAAGRHASMLPRFALVQLVGLGLNSVFVWLFMVLGLEYALAMGASVFLVPLVVYALCKYWVFRDPGQSGAKDPANGPGREET